MEPLGQYPDPTHVVAHLSDPHLLADALLYDAVDTAARLEAAAAAISAELVWVMGNHDERGAYAQALFDSDDAGPQDRVHDVAGLRIVALDSSVPGWHHGELSDDQLAWLPTCSASRLRTARCWRCTTRPSRSRCCGSPS